MTALCFLEFMTGILYVVLQIDIFAYQTSVWLFSVPNHRNALQSGYYVEHTLFQLHGIYSYTVRVNFT